MSVDRAVDRAVDPLAEPITIGRHRLRNRMVMTPHLGRLPPRRLVRYVTERAAGGVAMVILPAGQGVYANPIYPPPVAAADPAGYADADAVSFHVSDPRHRDVLLAAAHGHLARLAEAVHGGGAVAIGQIHHPGAERGWDNFQPTLAPSAVPADDTGSVPHALTVDEIDDLVHGYATTAAGIVAAGLDGVEVHAGHGYLLNRFLSPHYNRRTDDYGGSGPRRLRLLRRLLIAVRRAVGTGALLGVRLSAGEELAGGLGAAQVTRIATGIADLVDYLNLSLGNHDGLRDGRPGTAYTGPWLVRPAPSAGTARLVRAAVDIPVLVSGRITDPGTARGLLAAGTADLVGLARALIADPAFPRLATTGAGDRIVTCIGCNECVRVPFSCPVNPHAGREAEFDPPPKAAAGGPSRRRMVVVGAGPAGVAAATRAAAGGAQVILLEAAETTGGVLRELVNAPLLAGWTPMLHDLRGRLDQWRGRRAGTGWIDVRTGTGATASGIVALDPDVVLLATGGRSPAVELAAAAPALTTMDLLAGARPPAGVTVLVAGGAERHLEPFLAADLLAGEGWPVVLATECVDAGPDLEPRTRYALLRRLLTRSVTITPMTRLRAWTGATAVLEDLFTARRRHLDAGAVVVAHGRQADDRLRAELAAELPTDVACQLVGDALAPRRLSHAVLEGARFGHALATWPLDRPTVPSTD
ncbi:FAD-dependent oxidoreductase [Solwaraspora sp. WMMB335]|uniref:oxidoreductase n=1 Tax=Solwaraspora sp. WMMB335 TaxID=3404118 RepID=UPI003B93E74D